MKDDLLVESKLNAKLVELNVTLEETVEELEERNAPDTGDWRLASNHNETLVRDFAR